MSLIRTCEEKDRYLCDDFKVSSGKTLMEIVHNAIYSRRKRSRKYDKPYITDLFKEIPLTQDEINKVFQSCIDYAERERYFCSHISELNNLTRDYYSITDEDIEYRIYGFPDPRQIRLGLYRDTLHEVDRKFEKKILRIFINALREMSPEEKQKLSHMKEDKTT